MGHRGALRTLLVVIFGFGALLLAAPPAVAADPINCCQIGIDSLPDKFGAGAPPQFFTIAFHNGADRRVTRLNITFTASAPNLHSGQMHLQRRNGDNWHSVY